MPPGGAGGGWAGAVALAAAASAALLALVVLQAAYEELERKRGLPVALARQQAVQPRARKTASRGPRLPVRGPSLHAIVAFRLHPDVQDRLVRQLAQLKAAYEADGQLTDAGNLHVTLISLGATTPVSAVQPLLHVLHTALSRRRPVLVSISGVGSIKEGSSSVWTDVVDPDNQLRDLAAAVKQAAAQLGFKGVCIGAFQPHVTVATGASSKWWERVAEHDLDFGEMLVSQVELIQCHGNRLVTLGTVRLCGPDEAGSGSEAAAAAAEPAPSTQLSLRLPGAAEPAARGKKRKRPREQQLLPQTVQRLCGTPAQGPAARRKLRRKQQQSLAQREPLQPQPQQLQPQPEHQLQPQLEQQPRQQLLQPQQQPQEQMLQPALSISSDSSDVIIID